MEKYIMASIKKKIIISSITIFLLTCTAVWLAFNKNSTANSVILLATIILDLFVFLSLVFMIIVNSIEKNIKFSQNTEDVAKNIGKQNFKTSENEVILSTIINTAPYVIILTDNKGIVILVNPVLEKVFGYKDTELTGKHIDILFPCSFFGHKTEDKDKRYVKYSSFTDRYEIQATTKNGTPVLVELYTIQMEIKGKTYFKYVFADLTNQNNALRQKNEFVSLINHSLRTPLTSIQGALNILDANIYGDLPDKVKRLVSIANTNAARLGELIDDIRDIERLESGKIEFNLKNYNITDVIAESIEANKIYADNLKVNIIFNHGDKPIIVNTDISRIDQTFSNLLSSAIRCTPSGKNVVININKNNMNVRISVIDKGKGIPLEFQKMIFEKALPDSAEKTGIGGSGLGLRSSKLLIEKLGGTINFETKMGEGSTFYFELPIATL